MDLSKACTKCNSDNTKVVSHYKIKTGEERELYRCCDCGHLYAETANTFMHNIKTPLSKIATVINTRTEGMSFNATCRVHAISTHTLQSWENKFADIKDVLLSYTLAQTFLELVIEGDELYTKVEKNKSPSESEGWTLMLLDRASRFILDLSCDQKQASLFIGAMQLLSEVIKNTDDLSLLTDGERSYSKYLFQICYDLIRTGKPGRPRKVLPQNVKVRVKNKGSQSHKKGRKKTKISSSQT